MELKSILFRAIWAFSFYTLCTSSPRSPRDRKTKSPNLSGCTLDDSTEVSFTRFSPRFKRVKFGRINEATIIGGHDDSLWMDQFEGPGKETEKIELMRPKVIRTLPESISTVSQTLELPRPILRIRSHNKIHPTPIHLFKYGTINDLRSYYDRGVQLSLPEPVTKEIFNHLLDSSQFGKLKLIYERDRFKLIEFILRNEEISSEIILTLASNVQVLMNLHEPLREHSTLELRVTFYLLAINSDPQQVYNIITSLLDTGEDVNHHVLAREILNQYNRTTGSVPLLIFALLKGLELGTIIDFDPRETDRLDSANCSIIYHAASEGNLEVLESFSQNINSIKELSGVSPLIGAARNKRDDSLQVFLDDTKWPQFSEKDYEDAAFTAAIHNNFGIFKMFLTAGKIDLYAFHGNSTFLSVALKNQSFGFAQLLVERLNFNVNFVGEDPINPDGHALAYVLDKYSFVEMFLKRKASRNIKVYAAIDNENEKQLLTLNEYLELKRDDKLIKLFKKYPSD